MKNKTKTNYLHRLSIKALQIGIIAFLALNCLPTMAQQSDIKAKGVVTSDSDGLPLIGVSVARKGSSNGTQTRMDGSYELTAPTGSVLEFSYLGYIKQEVRVVAGTTTYNIVLKEDFQALEEVVVVGYGVQKKSVVTAAVSKVSGEELAKGSPTTFQNALKGKVSGIQITSESGAPGAGSYVRIRGIGGFNSSTPLYLVDGVQVDAINNINPSDIESVEVLKDAASAAIYGTRGANGVILVTTKQGAVSKPKLTYETSFGWQNPTKKLPYVDAAQYQTLVNEMNVNEGKTPTYASGVQPQFNTNWQDELINSDAPISNHKVSLTGGNDKNIYFLSFAYLNQEGTVAKGNSFYERYNARFNNTYTVMEDKSRFWIPKVTIGSNLSFANTKSMGIGNNSDVSGVLTAMALTPPNQPVYQDDPEQIALYNQIYPNYVKDATGRAYNIINMRELGNPVAIRDATNNNISKSNNFTGNLNLNVEIIPGLNFKTNLGLSWRYWGTRGYTPAFYISTATLSQSSSVNDSKNEQYTLQIENTLTYDKKIDDHQFTILAGQSAISSESTNISGTDYNLLRLGLDYAYIDAASADRSQERVSGGVSQHRLASFFGRFIYNYAEKYMLSAVLRRDGSTNFGPNRKWGNFPSLSAGWNISEESFMQSRPDWLYGIKLRASWGRNGNENLPAFSYVSRLQQGDNNVTLGIFPNDQIYTGIVSAGYSNANLQWETSEQTDIGLEFKLLNNALTFSADYFDKKTKDLLLYLQTPKYLGFWGMDANSGTMSNKGFEFEANYRFKVSDVHVSLNANTSHVKNIVTDRGPGFSSIAQLGAGLANADVAIVESGMPYGYFRGYIHDGLFQNWNEVNAHVGPSGKLLQPNAKPGDIRFKNLFNDDFIDDKDLTMIGNPNPKWIFGFNLNAEWRGFDFNAFFQGVSGNQIYNYDRRPNLPFANWHEKWLGRWTGEGSSTWWPRIVEDDAPNQNTGRVSNLYIENGDYLRLKVLQLGYTFPSLITRKALVDHLRVFIQGDNLLTFTKYTGYDPEVGSRSGMDSGTYPQARVFTVGASIGF